MELVTAGADDDHVLLAELTELDAAYRTLVLKAVDYVATALCLLLVNEDLTDLIKEQLLRCMVYLKLFKLVVQ